MLMRKKRERENRRKFEPYREMLPMNGV